jgi:hypothetical protein
MSTADIYLAARACAMADQRRDLAGPIYWHGKPSWTDSLRADHIARADAKAAARAAGQRKS